MVWAICIATENKVILSDISWLIYFIDMLGTETQSVLVSNFW